MTETPKLKTPLRIMEVHQDCYKIVGSDNVIVGTSTEKEFAQALATTANERERLREALEKTRNTILRLKVRPFSDVLDPIEDALAQINAALGEN